MAIREQTTVDNPLHQCGNCQSWVNQTVDLTSYVGQTIRVRFLVHQDGSGALTGIFVDDVQLTLPCGSISPTPAPRATPAPRSRADSESAPLAQLEMLGREAARDLRAPRLWWLADSKGSLFRLRSICSKTTLRILAASVQRAGPSDVVSHLASAAASEPLS